MCDMIHIWLIHEWMTSHMNESYDSHMTLNESYVCVVSEWVIHMWCDSLMTHSDIWLIHTWCASHMIWLIHMCDVIHIWLIHMCIYDSLRHDTHVKGLLYGIHAHMAHSYMWCDSIIFVRWLIYMCDTTHSWHAFAWVNSFMATHAHMCAAWLIHICDMTHSYVWYDFFTCVIWLVYGTSTYSYAYVCDTTQSHVCRDIFMCMTRLFHMCAMTHFIYGVATISRLLTIIRLFCKNSPIKETIVCKRGL